LLNLLITGNSGFIGSYIDKYFQNRFNCHGVSKSTGTDISNFKELEKINFSPDIIIHNAAYLGEDIEECFNTNVLGTLNICKFASQNKVKHLILISSISVYENNKNQYYGNYAMTKKQAEELAISYCKTHKINLTILRFSQIYDIAGKAETSQPMLYKFIKTIQEKKSITIYGKINPIRSYIHINDVLLTIEDIINKELLGIYNVVNEESHTIVDIANIIFNLEGIKENILFDKSKQNIPSIYIPSDNKYCSSFKFTNLTDGIKEIIQYAK